MENALLFDDVLEFAQFVRGCGSPRAQKHPLRLLHVEQGDGRRKLLLLGFRRPRSRWPDWLRLGDQPVQVKARSGNRADRLELAGGERALVTVLGERQGKRLSELLVLAPRPERDQDRQRVILWFHDTAEATRFVNHSLRLNNDRIQYATILVGDSESLLLRVEEPSYFLLQRYLERAELGVDLYTQPTDNLGIRWGHEHPLEAAWKAAARETNELLLVAPDGNSLILDQLRWQPVYDAAELQPAFSGASLTATQNNSRLTFRIPVTFHRRVARGEPQFWLISGGDQERLEELFVGLPRDAQDHFLLAHLTAGEGQKLFLLQKKTGVGRARYLEFPGVPLARFQGLPNLLLPVDRELRPLLRRDQYDKLLSLPKKQLTLLLDSDCPEVAAALGRPAAPPDAEPLPAEPAPEPAPEPLPKLVFLRTPADAFKPLASLIEHVVQAAETALEAVQQRAVLEFTRYAKLPSRADLLQAGAPDAAHSARQTDPEDQLQAAQDEAATDETLAQEVDQRLAAGDQTGPAAPLAPDDQRLQALEMHLLEADAPDPRAWRELSALKADSKDKLACLVEAWWALPRDSDEAREIERQLAAITVPPGPVNLAALAEECPAGDPGPLFALLLGRETHFPKVPVNQWLTAALTNLQAQEKKLRTKERWLLWNCIWDANADTRQTARIREQIVAHLNQVGLQPEEIPECLRLRLYQQRALRAAPGTRETRELMAARVNAARLAEELAALQIPLYRQPARAMAVRALRLTGEHKTADELETQLNDGWDQLSPPETALCHLVLAYAWRTHAAERSTRARQACDAALEDVPPENHKYIEQFAETLEQRSEEDNPAHFLSANNYRRYFPTIPELERHPVFQRILAFRKEYQAGRGSEAIEQAEAALDAATRWIEDDDQADLRIVARLSETLAGVLEKLRFLEGGGELVRVFEQFAETFQQRAQRLAPDSFYRALTLTALARALLSLGREAAGIAVLRAAHHDLNSLTGLDFIDAASSYILTVEQLPIENRLGRLIDVSKMIRDVELEQTLTSLHTAAFFWQLIDQLYEASISKDRLTLEMFRQYLDRDEYYIRRRILAPAD